MATPPIERSFPAFAPRVSSEHRASLLQIPLFDDESILFAVSNLSATAAIVATISGRLWSDARRDVVYFERDLAVAASAFNFVVFPLERGALLSLNVLPTQGAGIRYGTVWAQVQLNKGMTGSLTRTQMLLQGYCAGGSQLTWPGSAIEAVHTGRGVIRNLPWPIVLPTQVSIAVPASRRWRVITGVVRFTTDATPGLRSFSFGVFDGAIFVFESSTPDLQPAGNTTDWVLMPDIPTPTVYDAEVTQIPFVSDFELSGGMSIVMTANGALGPGDTIDAANLTVREWFDP